MFTTTERFHPPLTPKRIENFNHRQKQMIMETKSKKLMKKKDVAGCVVVDYVWFVNTFNTHWKM